MKIIPQALLLAFLSVYLAIPACTTTNPPQPGDPSTVDCVKGVAADAIADAQQKAITVIADGVTSGFNETVIVKNLEAIGVGMIPGALACGIQYLAGKFSYDAEHATSDQKRQKAAEASAARAYLRAHPVQFASPSP